MLWATPSIQQGPGVRTTRSGEASDAGRVDTSSFCVFVRFSISPSLSSVNSEYWQLLISNISSQDFASCVLSLWWIFFCRNSRHLARCTCCELEQLRSDSAGKSSDHQRLGRNRPWKLLPDNVRDVDFVWLASFPKTIVNACKQMGVHLLFSRAEIEFNIEIDTHVSNFIKFQSMQVSSVLVIQVSCIPSVRSVEQLTLDFQARLEALEEQKSLEACLGRWHKIPAVTSMRQLTFFLQQGCTFNGLRIIATVNVASYQLLEGLITHPEFLVLPTGRWDAGQTKAWACPQPSQCRGARAIWSHWPLVEN